MLLIHAVTYIDVRAANDQEHSEWHICPPILDRKLCLEMITYIRNIMKNCVKNALYVKPSQASMEMNRRREAQRGPETPREAERG